MPGAGGNNFTEMGYDEKQLLEKSRSGDTQAFETLIESYQKKMFNLAFRMTGNYDDASDMTQEALIRAFKSINGFREQSSFSTWLYRITTNVCLDEIRKRKNKWVLSLDEDVQLEDGEIKRQIVSGDPLSDEIAEREELRGIIRDAIAGLPEDQRIVITLRDIQGMSYDEISQVLECPSGTVKSRINRARLALKQKLRAKRELFDYEFVK